MKNRISWDKALGIGIEIAPKGQRGLLDGHGTYSELALYWETWLRDTKGYPEKQLIDHSVNNNLRKEFFFENIENHPEWFTNGGMKRIETNQGITYVCKGCQRVIDGICLYTCNH
ncbi:hypothetical protein [Peribacillus sp. R9-11]|uniref:hypothetical protein n=1 Tax=Peribacillus sp. R9-11 TaxID=3073271 RepID=UPI0028683FA8|nr:hypothetical protein [Peribacillus sp. R9-11]WMX58064.1 hypothetical protein RE409_13070 [Peribacillus sp. R9-11]